MPTGTLKRPGLEPEALMKSFGSDALSLPDNRPNLPALAAVSSLLGSMARRLIEDALLEQLPEVWERRARQIEIGSPMVGNVLLEDIPDRAEAAAACRERAELLRRYPLDGLPELGGVVDDALLERGIHGGDRDA